VRQAAVGTQRDEHRVLGRPQVVEIRQLGRDHAPEERGLVGGVERPARARPQRADREPEQAVRQAVHARPT
jgi:hypothetical protein